MKAFGESDNPSISDFARLVTTGKEYAIAFVRTDGEFDVVERFVAADDDAANEYAEANHAGEWYVLDASGRNINGGN
jgi:hypothetical protein